MKRIILKLVVLMVAGIVAGCATTPSVVSDFKKHDEAIVVTPKMVVVRNPRVIRWGDIAFTSGYPCRLLQNGSIQVMEIAKRPGDFERTFFLYYWIKETVKHTEEDCPPETIFIMGEEEFTHTVKHKAPEEKIK